MSKSKQVTEEPKKSLDELETVSPKKKLGARDRNRASLIRAAQRCLINTGPNVTIEYFAEFAEVSPATIYKHFHHKDDMFAEALGSFYVDWLVWANEVIREQTTDPLSEFILPLRLLARLKKTHPEFAAAVVNSSTNLSFITRALAETAEAHYLSLVKSGVLPSDNTDVRFLLFTNAGLGFFLAVLRNEYEPSGNLLEDFELLFGILGVSKAKLKKIISIPLDAK
jgi:AcrR family transcriptional regulator